jgi:hypothetical protein
MPEGTIHIWFSLHCGKPVVVEPPTLVQSATEAHAEPVTPVTVPQVCAVLQVSPLEVQSVHIAPPVPHALSLVPA